MPRSRGLRVGLGSALILGGFLGFLPILGFWMAPLGLIVLSVDSPLVRRWRRRLDVRLGRWVARRRGKPRESEAASRTGDGGPTGGHP
ncbi:hypothetical protein J2S73_002773 [Amorphus orientalis]|uniref:Transmembrane protein (PGPGW) n=1 Tax=Amorphus orientalis TaxID=649198 RepID=A0AAE4ASI9_9HYPH|nr:hypothetical protein [Amorphus orientalis]